MQVVSDSVSITLLFIFIYFTCFQLLVSELHKCFEEEAYLFHDALSLTLVHIKGFSDRNTHSNSKYKKIYHNFWFVWGPCLAKLRCYSWLCIQVLYFWCCLCNSMECQKSTSGQPQPRQVTVLSLHCLITIL